MHFNIFHFIWIQLNILIKNLTGIDLSDQMNPNNKKKIRKKWVSQIEMFNFLCLQIFLTLILANAPGNLWVGE